MLTTENFTLHLILLRFGPPLVTSDLAVVRVTSHGNQALWVVELKPRNDTSINIVAARALELWEHEQILTRAVLSELHRKDSLL